MNLSARATNAGKLAFTVLLAACTAQVPAGTATPGSATTSAPTPHATPRTSPSLRPSRSPDVATSDPTSALNGMISYANDGYYVANADGTDAHKITDEADYCCLRISPDHTRFLNMPGGHIAGSAAIRGGTISIDGDDFESLPLIDPTLILVPQVWSPDGTRIAYEGWDESDPTRTGVYTARPGDGSDLVRVSTAPGRPHDSALDYSPDGSQIVFYRAVEAEPDFPIDIGGSLWVANVDGTDAHELETGDVRPWWTARWSPDGSRIVFGVERLQPAGGIWTIRPDGSDLTKVFEDSDGRYALGPIWAPDGTKIMFVLHPHNDAFEHASNEIYVVNVDGTGLRQVVGGHAFKSTADWWD